MPAGPAQAAKRILVQLLHTLARHYNLILRLARDADDSDHRLGAVRFCLHLQIERLKLRKLSV